MYPHLLLFLVPGLARRHVHHLALAFIIRHMSVLLISSLLKFSLINSKSTNKPQLQLRNYNSSLITNFHGYVNEAD